MEILIVTSHFSILQLFIQQLKLVENKGKNFARFSYQDHELDVFISKSNGNIISYHLTKVISKNDYDLIIHLDRCYSLKDTIESGNVVCVLDDYFGDIGIDSNGNFSSLFDLGIQDKNEEPFTNEIIENAYLLPNLQSKYRSVSGITCNTYPENLFGIANTYVKNHPDVISFNGASVLYVCKEENLNLIQMYFIVDQLENANQELVSGDEEVNALTNALEFSLKSIFKTN